MAEIIAERKAKLQAPSPDSTPADKPAPAEPLKPKKNKVEGSNPQQKIGKKVSVTIEIDFAKLEEIIAKNHSLNDGNKDEYAIFQRCFNGAVMKGKKYVRGRDSYLWDAFKNVLTKNAKECVKKVSREDVV